MKTVTTLFSALFIFCVSSYAQWTNYQSAEFIIGQPDFTTYYSTTSAIGLSGPYAVAVDVEHSKLYVADVDNHRVLRYAYPITSNQPTAELVFGEPDFTTTYTSNQFTGQWPAPTASQILYPMALAVYNGDLWVLDEGNERVVKFSQAYGISTNNPGANLVLGQSTFTTRDFSCSSSTFYTPWGMTIDNNGNLWVADTGNYRVLKFGNVSTLTSGASAVGVLGKSSFTDASIPSTTAQNNFSTVSSLCSDNNGNLWVCDKGNNRVLKFSNLPESPLGESASGVLGQSDFTTKGLSTTPFTFMRPFGVCADGKGDLYVADQDNNRVTIFLNASLKTNGASADNWLGSSFYSNSYTYGQKSFAPQSITNMAVDNVNGKLFVADLRASRVMQFSASGTLGTNVQDIKKDNANPFGLAISRKTDCIQFQFQNMKQGIASLKIYNIQGIEITELKSSNSETGLQTINWSFNKIPKGVYLCNIKNGIFSETKKFIIE